MSENKSPRTFSGKAMMAAAEEAAAIPNDRGDRIADLVYGTMGTINRAEEEIRREARSVVRQAEQVLADLDSGYRIRYPVQADRLAEYVAARQRGFDLLVSLIGQDAVNRYRAMGSEPAPSKACVVDQIQDQFAKEAE